MIRWGLIGCGAVTEVKSGPGFQNAADSSLVAVMRRDAAKAEDYAHRHNVPRWYADADALINDREVDVVSIATPPSTHMELALKVCAACKPTLVEKPMALSHDQCTRMIEAFASAGVPLFVAYYRRALPRFVKIKSLIDESKIGRVLAVNIAHRLLPAKVDPANLPWRFRPEIAGGGLFVDLGSHTLDIIDFLLGPIERVDGYAKNRGGPYAVEDAVVMAFELASGVLGAGSWHFNAHEPLDRVEIAGTHGEISFSTFGDSPIQLTTCDDVMSFPISNPKAIQQPLIQSIVDELHGRGHCPSTGETASRTSWAMDQVLQPYYEKG